MAFIAGVLDRYLFWRNRRQWWSQFWYHHIVHGVSLCVSMLAFSIVVAAPSTAFDFAVWGAVIWVLGELFYQARRFKEFLPRFSQPVENFGALLGRHARLEGSGVPAHDGERSGRHLDGGRLAERHHLVPAAAHGTCHQQTAQAEAKRAAPLSGSARTFKLGFDSLRRPCGAMLCVKRTRHPLHIQFPSRGKADLLLLHRRIRKAKATVI